MKRNSRLLLYKAPNWGSRASGLVFLKEFFSYTHFWAAAPKCNFFWYGGPFLSPPSEASQTPNFASQTSNPTFPTPKIIRPLRPQQVNQRSHMVSSTRCPVWNDELKKWSESRAAVPKGRCPVGHGGEFPYVLRGHSWGLRINFPWYSMGILHLFQFFDNLPCYSMEILHFSYFHQYSMLFNGKRAFFCFLHVKFQVLILIYVVTVKFQSWSLQK